MLLYSNETFVQVLEGEERVIDELVDRIARVGAEPPDQPRPPAVPVEQVGEELERRREVRLRAPFLELLGFPRESLELLMGIEVEGPDRPSFRPSPVPYALLPRLLLLGATGIFGYSFLEENQDRVQGTIVDGVAPAVGVGRGASAGRGVEP